MEETVREVLYETCYHASRSFPLDFSHKQTNEDAKGSVFSLLSARGIYQLKEKWDEYKRPRILKKSESLFISPRGDYIAVAARNQITILRKDDNYMEPCGIFTSNARSTIFFHGAWSDSHGVLGVIDGMDTLYFIKSNGEEITRITKSQFKLSSAIIGLIVPDEPNSKNSCLCSFTILTSDGFLHDIEVGQDPNAIISSMPNSNNRLAAKKQFPQNVSCLDFHPNLSLLVLVVGAGSVSDNSADNSGFYCVSLWRITSNSELEHLFSSPHFEGLFSTTKGYIGTLTTPKVLVSSQGKYVAALDLTGSLNIFNLDGETCSLSIVDFGKSCDSRITDKLSPGTRKNPHDIVDFTWWSDNILVLAKRSGVITMLDILRGMKLIENDPVFSMPILGNIRQCQGFTFILETKSSEGGHSIDLQNQLGVTRLRWSLVSFSERSVSEMYNVFISNQQYPAALDFASRHGLEKDEVFKSQWLHSDQGTAEIKMFLSKIEDQMFVLSECLNRIGPTEDAAKALLSYGLQITEKYRFSEPEDGNSAIWKFRMVRLQLLQCRDRLETFVGINMGRFSSQEYGKFQIVPLNEAAVNLAESGKIGALNLLFKRHPYSLSPFILVILAAIPETIPVQTYGQLLPGRSALSTVALRDKDWVECEEMITFLDRTSKNNESNVQVRTELIMKHNPGFVWPAVAELSLWYQNRARDIDSLSGLLDNCLSMVEIACQKGIVELERYREDISYLSQLIYSDICDEEISFSMSLVAWEQLSDYEKFKMMLKGVNEETVVIRLREKAIPFMQNRSSKDQMREDQISEDIKHSDSFLVRWLKEIAALNKLDICLKVIEDGCGNFQLDGIFKDEVEAIEIALYCIYACTLTDRWNAMASILSKLPQIALRGKTTPIDKNFSPRLGIRGFGSPRLFNRNNYFGSSDTHEDLMRLNKTISSSGNSGEHLDLTDMDISVESLEKRVKLAEGHVEAGTLLAYYQVPKPMSFFLGASSDEKGVKQLLRLILSKFGRRQPGRSDNDWANMWRDMLCLQEKAFPFLDIEYMLMEFCRGLLKAGKFSLARNYLKGTGNIALATEKAENLVIQAAREYFFSASSLACSEIWKAKECLNLFPNSKNVKAEADIIDALTVKLPNLGVTLLPMQFRQIRNPMEIINMVIANQSGAYLDTDELIQIAKVLGLNSQDDIAAVQEAVAREAAVTGDLQLAFDLCLVLAKKGHGSIWDLCAAIARSPVLDNMDISSRKQLLGFALSHCDEESIGTIGEEGNDDQEVHFNHIKNILSTVGKETTSGTSWDSLLRENGKILSFAALQLPWLLELSKKAEYGKRTILGSKTHGKKYASVRTEAIVSILSWLARNDIAPSDDVIASLAKSIMEPPVTEEEDILGCSFLLNLIDAFHGVKIIEDQLTTREGYQEICSIMNTGMTYSSLHNSSLECSSPAQRKKLLVEKFQEKHESLSSDAIERMDKVQPTFWRQWKSKLEEQKRLADQAMALEQIIPGVETARFLSGDRSYIESVVFSLIDSAKLQKKSILKEMLNLANTYGLNCNEVLLRFIGSVLVSELWGNDDIQAEISDYREEVLSCAVEIINMISSNVYPAIDGCNKQRLAYIYSILSDCYSQLKGVEELELKIPYNPGRTYALESSQFYKVLEQECRRVSFIKMLNFKNIAGLGGLNFEHFNDEVYNQMHESCVDAVAKMVETLVGICKDSEAEGLISWQAVYKHHVQSLLTTLATEIKTKPHDINPNDVSAFVSELEQNYDSCRIYIRAMSEPDMLDTMGKYYKLSVPQLSCGDPSSESEWLDCLLLVLNFWIRLADDIQEFVGHQKAEEKHSLFNPESLSKCLKDFRKLVVEDQVSANQGWATVLNYIKLGVMGGLTADISTFCRAMAFSGCGFRAIAVVFSEEVDSTGNPDGSQSLSRLYLSTLESALLELGADSNDHHNLHHLLSSLSKLESNLDDLKVVRFAVWERLSKFFGNMQLQSHTRVYILELMQCIAGRNLGGLPAEILSDVQPWEGWDESQCTESRETAQGGVTQPDMSSKFTNTLVALKSTQLVTTISPSIEITPDDLSTLDSAVSCFFRLSASATSEPHFDSLRAILEEWEELFTSTKEEELFSSNNFSSDDWDEGWEHFQEEEEPVENEKKKVEPISIHPLHLCWAEIIKKIAGLSQFSAVMKLIDGSLCKSKGVLLAEDDAQSLCELIIGIDSFMALKIMLLLPYEVIWFKCLGSVEAKLKLVGNLDTISGDYELLALMLSSGVVSTIATDPSYSSTFSYLCHSAGHLSHLYQESLLSLLKHRGTKGSVIDRNGCNFFGRTLFPCFVSELVIARHFLLAGFLVCQFMHTHASLSLINVAEASLRRYFEGEVRKQQNSELGLSEMDSCRSLVNTISSLRVKLGTLLQSALSALTGTQMPQLKPQYDLVTNGTQW
ncbi:MAG2-interacting protein 2-like isoform X2 [Tasmannia lanceolata]|uniref:MAG2-interacting protein 2-like isoform X2 n=1 Tax=Tasmannia lanceolata TaxID=3420 RepID=UPI0040636986